jgi:BolA protein
MTKQRTELIRDRIARSLDPTHLEVIDESHLHVGHEGAKDGRGHFRVRIASSKFSGLRPIQQHRLVYDAVGDLMTTDIHALAIEVVG